MEAKNSLFRKYFLDQSDFSQNPEPVITLCYRETPEIDCERLQYQLSDFLAKNSTPHPVDALEESHWQKKPALLLSLAYNEHQIDIIGLKAPLSASVLQKCVQATGWNESFKEEFNRAQAYINFAYSGSSTDAIEKYIALYQAASLLPQENLIGVINEPAFNCHPGEAILDIVDEKMLDVARQTPPLIYWSGFLRAILDNNQWLLTRGNHLFGLPDFALSFTPHTDPILVHEVFQDMFFYMYFENKAILPGDDISLDEELNFRILEPTEKQQPLKGLGELFILEPWNAK
jgi:hypothetical protein